ncbi:MAG: hypothetical protein AABW86_03570 [Candidatus Micrarchaeota archaeon]
MDLESAFQSVSKVLFGQEIGQLNEFREYLEEIRLPYQTKKSAVSGKDVIVSLPFYPPDAKFISQDEINSVKFEPLDVNEIKDIDSLLGAVSERVIYCGNKLFGKNEFVSAVDNCTNCFYVSDSHRTYNVRYGAHLSYQRDSEFVFGLSGFPNSKYAMRSIEGIGLTRCFESYYSTNLSDVYYGFNCSGVSDSIFAFNLRSKRNVIGNLQLPKERYGELKKKLISEIADVLKRKKRIFSIADISVHSENGKAKERTVEIAKVPDKVEQAFGKTSNLVFGKERHNIADYGNWLLKYVIKVRRIQGAFGTPAYMIDDLPIVCDISPARIVTLDEALKSASKSIEIKDGETPTITELMERVARVAYFTFEFIDGINDNVIETPSSFTAVNTYRVWDAPHGKNSAYTSAAVYSEYIFGSHFQILNSQFCINCYDVADVMGCFEVDSSNHVRNSYFCHNSENLDNCMFCFNAKSLRYAIGNTEVGREEYLRIRKILLDYVNKELDEGKGLELGIFSIGKSK